MNCYNLYKKVMQRTQVYTGITQLHVVGKLFLQDCKKLLGNYIRIRKVLLEGQAGFRGFRKELC